MDNKIKISELKTYIKKLNELIEIDSRYPFLEENLEFDVWKLKTSRFIEKFFGENSVYLEKFKEIFYNNINHIDLDDEEKNIKNYKNCLKKSKVVLDLILEELEKDLELTKTKKYDSLN